MTDDHIESTISGSSSTIKDGPTKRRGPPRSGSQVTIKAAVAPTAKKNLGRKAAEKKSEKAKPSLPTPAADPNCETVITENGLALHPNGMAYILHLSELDHVYLLSEPPGEPYYIARIMEFLYLDPALSSKPENDDLPLSSTTGLKVKSIRVNWFYRPQDISHKMQPDTRSLYATMHSDVNPISTVRGVCKILHRSEIPNHKFEEYKKGENNFWFSRLHDRYIQRNYDVVPTSEITNVPEHVGAVLRETWKYVIVENGAKKELCMEPRKCTKCGEWCRR
jgi:BAH domain